MKLTHHALDQLRASGPSRERALEDIGGQPRIPRLLGRASSRALEGFDRTIRLGSRGGSFHSPSIE
jgi:hypothetical protein